jgi:hypothetical protein
MRNACYGSESDDADPGARAAAGAPPPQAAGPPVVKIATFNIKVFGPTKASHEAVVASGQVTAIAETGDRERPSRQIAMLRKARGRLK